MKKKTRETGARGASFQTEKEEEHHTRVAIDSRHRDWLIF